MSATVAKAYERLSFLAASEYRGRGDTWGASLDRKARQIGISPTYAKRIWDRWQQMKDVSGNVFDAITAAYDAECSKHEKAADQYRTLREARHGSQAGEGAASAAVGMGAVALFKDVGSDGRGRPSSDARTDVERG